LTARLKPHRLISILPPLTPVELDVATERVRLYGQTMPIETVDGEIIVGFEEYQACVAAGVKPRTTKANRPDCLVEYVARSLPRNLTSLDRACIAVLAEEEWKSLGRERMRAAGRIGGRLRGKGPRTVRAPFGHDDWYKVAARIVGATPSAVKRLATLRRSAPDVFEAVRARKLVILRDARQLARNLPTAKARAKVIALKEQHPNTRVARLMYDVLRDERAPLKPSGPEGGTRWIVHEGPMAREGAKVPDGSIDAVYADIVYGDVSMAVDVGKLARRALKPSGILALINGNERIVDILDALRKLGLKLVAVGSAHVAESKLFTRSFGSWVNRIDSVPVWFWAREGDGPGRRIEHLHFDSPVTGKPQHTWQKSVEETLDIVRSIAPPGSRILDPCVGSGTTGVAALRHDCEFVGIDVDANAVQVARARLAEASCELDGSTPAKKSRVA
jgi:hypothetical protein